MPLNKFFSGARTSYRGTLLPEGQTTAWDVAGILPEVADALVVVRIHCKQTVETRIGFKGPMRFLVSQSECVDGPHVGAGIGIAPPCEVGFILFGDRIPQPFASSHGGLEVAQARRHIARMFRKHKAGVDASGVMPYGPGRQHEFVVSVCTIHSLYEPVCRSRDPHAWLYDVCGRGWLVENVSVHVRSARIPVDFPRLGSALASDVIGVLAFSVPDVGDGLRNRAAQRGSTGWEGYGIETSCYSSYPHRTDGTGLCQRPGVVSAFLSRLVWRLGMNAVADHCNGFPSAVPDTHHRVPCLLHAPVAFPFLPLSRIAQSPDCATAPGLDAVVLSSGEDTMRVCRIGVPPATLIGERKPRRRAVPAADVELADVIKRKHKPFMSYFPARKQESRMERLLRYSHRAMAALLETDPDVLTWTTEVEPQTVKFEGREREIAPHFLTTSAKGTQAIRLTRGNRISGRSLEFYMTVTADYAEQDVQFRVERECDVLAHPRLPAARTILWHRPWLPSNALLAATAALADCPPSNLGELNDILGGAENTWPFIISMIARGWVDVGQAVSIGPETLVRACKMGVVHQ